MAFTPNSRVYLIDTPLDNKYKNTIHFDDIGDQHTYFAGRANNGHAFEGVTYQRKDNMIVVDEHIDNLWDANYVMYQNANFNNKWFYAFITRMEWGSDRSTKVYIETDVFQTWLFDVEIKESFVVREHVDNDTIGKHLVDEQLETGELKMSSYLPSGVLGNKWNILAVSDNSPLGNTELVGNKYGNLVTGLTYYPFKNTAAGITWLKDTIKLYTDAGKADAIVMIFTVPEIAVPSITNNGGNWTHGEPITTEEPFGFHSFSSEKKLDNIDGYVPRNNKLYTFPYKFLQVSNNTGLCATFRYEDFLNSLMGFMVTSAIMPNPTIMLCPTDYKGVGLSYEHGLPLSGYPLCSWVTDSYAAWVAQNTGTMAMQIVGATAATIGGVMTGNVIAMGGGAMAAANALSQIHQAAIQPDQAKGQVGGGSIAYATSMLDYYFAHMTIKAEFAKRIDGFFTMYGYKVNTLKIPETSSRQNWNYVQTIDINIEGPIPADDMQRLKKVYDEGVTLWHTTNHFMDYSQSNSIV